VGAVLALAERFWPGEVRGAELVPATAAVEETTPRTGSSASASRSS
jgi:hypothetical protein